MAAREAAEAMGRGLRQSVSASGGHVPVKAARELHDRLMTPGDVRPSDVVDVVHALARLIEVEELRYERLVGDSGGSHRAGYAIGRILSLVQDDVSGVDVVSKYCLDALTQPSTPPKAQAAGLRLLCAVVSVTGFQFPLTDERLVDRLRAWALGDLRPHADAAPRTARREAADAAEAAERAAAEAEASGAPTAHLARRAATLASMEALRVKTYALGCLAVALEAEDVASELVRDGVMVEILTPLRRALVDGAPAEGADVVEAFARETILNRDDRDDDFGRSTIAEDEEHVVAFHEQMATETGDRDAAAKSLAEALTSRAPADAPSLPARLLEARLRALAATGEYIECFGQALQCGAVEVALALVRGSYWNEDAPAWPREAAERRLRRVDAAVSESFAARRFAPCAPQLPESLAAVCSLLAHRKFAVTFVDRGGVAALLSIPKGALSVDGFHRCLFAVSQSPSAMERLLAPGRDAATSAAARRCVDVALEALDGGHETARRHAALFLALSFPFPAVVDAFDAAGGLRPLLNLLRHAAQLSAAATAAAKQTACHACHALRQYARAHLHRRVSRFLAGNAPDPGYRAVDLGQAATDRNLRAASRDPETAASMQKASWLPVDAFVAQGGHEIVLALMHVAAGDRHFHECVPAGLAALRIATLHPSARNATVAASVGAPASLSAADVLLEIAARAASAQDAEAAVDALQIVRQLVAPPPALASAASAASAPPPRRLQRERSRVSTTPSKKLAHRRGSTAAGPYAAGPSVPSVHKTRLASLDPRMEKKETESVGEEKVSAFDRAFRPGRAALREAGGLRALLAMLTRGARRLPPPNDDAARALCCDALIAMAREPAIAQTLQTLQVARRLTEMVSSHKHKRGLGSAGAGSEARDPLAGKNPGDTGAAAAAEAGAEFHRAAVELIAITAGGAARGSAALAAANAVAVAPLRRMERHAIAAATRVQYPHEDLLRLIHEHLSNAGLAKSADALAAEAAEKLGTPFLGRRRIVAEADASTPASRGKTSPRVSPRLRLSGGGSASRARLPSETKHARLKARRGSLARRPGTAVAGVFGGTATPRPGAFTLGMRAPPRAEAPEKKTPETPASRNARASPRRSKRKASALEKTQSETANVPVVPDAATPLPVKSRVHARFSPRAGEKPDEKMPPARCGVVDRVDREGCGVRSKLDGVMTTYLRAQHRQCVSPAAACAPFSLLEPHACAEPRHPLAAPANLTKRVHRREWCAGAGGARGGAGGGARDRHFVFGRFRPVRALRDEGATFTCAAFVGGLGGARVLAGTNDGTLRLFDASVGDVLEYADAGHSGSVRAVSSRVSLSSHKPFALSSSAGETFLWDVSVTPEFSADGPAAALEGACSAAFDEHCRHVFHAGGNTPGTASLFDVAAGRNVSRFFAWDEIGLENAQAASRRFVTRATSARRFADVAFGPTGTSLVLWGNTLWDVRLPHPVRTFDAFSDGGGACFHPRGDEVVLNSEVWDLRSERLLRSVHALDGCKLAWTRTGDCAVASYRPPWDESILSAVRKTKHPLRGAFRAVDGARDYAEIKTVDVDRAVLDVSWDAGADASLCAAECDPLASNFEDSVVRVYEAGRMRPTEEDSDAEDSDEIGDGRSEGDDDGDEGFFHGALDENAMAAMREDDEDDDDERRAARTAAAIAGDGAALAGLRALLGGLVADRIRDAVEAEGAGADEGEEEEEEDDDVEFSLEEDSAGDDDSEGSASGSDSLLYEESDSESDSVLLSLSSGDGDEDEDSMTDSGGEESDEDDSAGGF